MTRLPRLAGPEVIGRLAMTGFVVVRVRGSHHRLAHQDGWSTTVPVHGAEVIGPGLLSKILRDCDISREEFEALDQ